MSTRQTIRKTFAEYIISEISPEAFAGSYVLIKNGKDWGTIHHFRKGAELLWIDQGSHRLGIHVYKSRAAIEGVIDANEKRLEAKANK